VAPELKRRLDYSDYLATPDDGKRYEILDGDLCVNPSPSPRHQRVSRRLQLQLENYFHRRSIGEVFNAPIDLILGRHDVMVPDLVVVSEPAFITERGIEGPPLLIVEILSPSTQTQDRGSKAHRYAESGVEHYWIVDPKAKRLECHRLTGRVYQRVAEIGGESIFEHPDLAGLKIDLDALW
jgi:Uma2 family endonuclease